MDIKTLLHLGTEPAFMAFAPTDESGGSGDTNPEEQTDTKPEEQSETKPTDKLVEKTPEDIAKELEMKKTLLAQAKAKAELEKVNKELAELGLTGEKAIEKQTDKESKDLEHLNKKEFNHTPSALKSQYRGKGKELPTDEDIESKYL